MTESQVSERSSASEPVLQKFNELYHSLLEHDGFGEIRLEMRILKFGQKEIILHCGKQYRFVVDFVPSPRGKRNQSNRERG